VLHEVARATGVAAAFTNLWTGERCEGESTLLTALAGLRPQPRACLALAVPAFGAAGYVRARPAGKPKLGALMPVIAAILEADRAAPPKQQNTAKRVFKQLRDEHGYGG
jgi:hypothetical protein